MSPAGSLCVDSGKSEIERVDARRADKQSDLLEGQNAADQQYYQAHILLHQITDHPASIPSVEILVVP